jgi:hypothetical protein
MVLHVDTFLGQFIAMRRRKEEEESSKHTRRNSEERRERNQPKFRWVEDFAHLIS